MQHLTSPCTTRRRGLRFRRIDSGGAGDVVASKGVLFVADYDASVEKRGAECPEYGGEAAGGEEVVDVNVDGGFFWGSGVARC